MRRQEQCAKIKEAIENIDFKGTLLDYISYGNGHINDTFQVRFIEANGSIIRYILQRMNHETFKNPEQLMENIFGVTKFLRNKIEKNHGDVNRETMNIILTKDGKAFYKDSIGSYWRGYQFIENADCYDIVQNPNDFYQSAMAFGSFQYQLADYPAQTLHETIPDFHNTPVRLEKLKKAIEKDLLGRVKEVKNEIRFVLEREEFTHVLMNLYAQGKLPLKVTHNDTKLNNVMIDRESKKGLCVIDLDTVMPGFSVNDFGDSIRFGASTGGEDEPDLSKVSFDLGLYELYTKGFLEGCKGSLTDTELEMLPVGAKMMTLECGMRFLTDYLEGDTYFKLHREKHNLDRCRTQFKLVADMEKNWDAMKYTENLKNTRKELKLRGETKMKAKINIGIIGLGGRGMGLLKMFLLHPDVNMIAVCDTYEDRSNEAAELIEKAGQERPYKTIDYNDIIAMDKVDAIILCTSWEHHIDIAIQAMEAGKYVGCEVGGAYSIAQCWKLVDTYERTKVPVMMLENCNYGREELMILNMVKQGVFGEVVHCSGGYLHDLRNEVAFGKENRHYRLNNYIHRNTENYPTHELGPIARILDINHGNRMLTLTSMASKAKGLKEYIKTNKSDDKELLETEFNQGDIVNTIIKCANGETILLTLDTTLPRYYSRGLVVKGTKGIYTEENQSIFLDNTHKDDHFDWKEHWGNIENYREEYDHPIWKKYMQEGIKEGHGGMDWLVFCDFVDSVKNQMQTPIDVYDMASWMCISTLSEDSIALGGQPVAIPDFTNGAWMSR